MASLGKRRPLSFSSLIVISDSDSDNDNEPRNTNIERNGVCNVDSGDDTSDARSSPNPAINGAGPSHTDPILISDDEDRIVQPTNNVVEKGKKRKRTASGLSNGVRRMKTKKKKRKHSDGDSDSGSDRDYLHMEVYNSDEESDLDEPNSSLFGRRNKIVNLLNDSARDRLKVFPMLSENRIETIISCRPFENWRDLVQKMNNTKGLKPEILNNLDKIILAEEMVSALMKKCVRLAGNIKNSISSKGSLVSKQPVLLNEEYRLTSYQLVGLNWLAIMHDSSLNSILADEMGLGKTIQVIAFLAYLKEIKHDRKEVPHLIIVPASTLDNWKEELSRWCPSMKVTIYHGNQDERKYIRFRWFSVGFEDAEIVLTTYDCVTKPVEKKLFRTKEFNYIIFDEAHMLKNMNSMRYDAFIHCNGNYKILLTGTPLQNNLLELISLLNFLMPDLFESRIEHIKLLFSKSNLKAVDAGFEQQKIEQAKKIMEPFMLRRLKNNVLRDLPTKTNYVLPCKLLSDQACKYEELVEEFKQATLAATENIQMVYFMKLRKLANHPLMLRYIFTQDKLDVMAERLLTDETYRGSEIVQHITEDLYFKSDFELHLMCDQYPSLKDLGYELPIEEFSNSGKLREIQPLLKRLKSEGHRVLMFSQFMMMLDILQEFLKINNYMYLRLDGSTPVQERKAMIDLYNSQPNIFVFLLSTKAGGLGINLTAADTVIIHDIDFNPYNDKQAEDRCHRVGQTKDVKIYKLVSKDTVEERMNEIATKKLELEIEMTSNRDNDEEETKGVLNLLKESLGLAQT